ncbi:TonB-dependent receptor [Zeimonas arvi]|nr:TonB-dependent receptor [Zeimonas arvi]
MERSGRDTRLRAPAGFDRRGRPAPNPVPEPMTANTPQARAHASGARRIPRSILSAAVASSCAALAHAQEPAPAASLPEVTVTATRSEALVDTVPQSVTIVRREEIERQVSAGSGLGDILGKLVPGFAVGRESPSTFTQTLRGRNINVLIDGVPQSTNRNGARILTLIDPSAVERIEVIRGATAIYGDGATGGVVNIITRKGGGAVAHSTEVGGNLSLSHPADSLGTVLRHTSSGSKDKVDFLFNVAVEQTGAFFDADGDRIPPSGANQGSLSETRSYSLLGKLGYQLDASQSIQLTAQAYKADQDTDYTTDPSVPAAPLRGHKSRAISGLSLDEKEGSKNSLVSLDYNNKEIWGSKMHAQLFARDYTTVYAPYRRHDGTGAGPEVFQSFIDSTKLGGRLEFDTLLSDRHGVSLVWGADHIREETSQSGYVHDPAAYAASGGRVFRSTGQVVTWVPPYDVVSTGLFGQLEWQATAGLLLRGGLRHESIDVDVGDFTNIDGGAVGGGSKRYSDTLYNLGAVFDLNERINLYASYNQGFSLPDMGLTLRGAAAGSSFAALNTQPQVVDNYEVGVRGNWGGTRASFALFWSENDLGARSGGLNAAIVRAPEKIYGFEATVDHRFANSWRAGGTFSWLEGKKYAATGAEIGYLGNDAIMPPKLTAYVEHQTTPKWSNRLQVLYSGSRDRFDPSSTAAYQNRIEDYAILDWVSEYRIGKKGTLSFGINNLLNEQYHSTFSQTVVNPRVYGNTAYAAASGAVLHATYKHAW